MTTKSLLFEDDSYICLPRTLLNGLFSEDESKRTFCKVIISLLILSTPFKRTIEYRKKTYSCNIGELIINCTELSKKINIEYHKARSILKKLEDEKFIDITVLGGVWKIRVIDYLKHTRQKLKNKQSGTTGGKSPARTARQEYEQKVLEENKKRLREMMNR